MAGLRHEIQERRFDLEQAMAYKQVDVTEKPTVEDFYSFVEKRQNVWFLKECVRQPRPWTDDPILQRFHFCNVYRCLDKGTKWAYDNIVLGEENFSRLLFRLTAYRCCNLPATFEALGLPSPNGELPKFLDSLGRLSEKSPIFSTAYRASAFGPTPRLVIYGKILNGLKDRLSEISRKVEKAPNLKSVVSSLTDLWGVGPFIANEILLDLKMSSWGDDYVDDPFVNIGPGAAFGLDLMYGRLGKRGLLEKLLEIRDLQYSFLALDYPGPSLTSCDVQFSMCEFRKYVSLRAGGGKSRIYAGHAS